ncbi:MAG: hypothetical protein Q7V63_04040 [Gammaproteobacteria bacterium]|nr:hypothetical protein [Gammaproteobacteria bacterium]
MQKLLISVPDHLIMRMRGAIPSHQYHKLIVSLLEREIELREKELYECALQVEHDQELNHGLKGWNNTLTDGLNNEFARSFR